MDRGRESEMCISLKHRVCGIHQNEMCWHLKPLNNQAAALFCTGAGFVPYSMKLHIHTLQFLQ